VTTPELHREGGVARAGAPLAQARAAVLLLHGRGGSAEDILGLADAIGMPAGVAFLAPRASGHTWYPNSFLAPLEANGPWLWAALARVDELVREMEAAGVPFERQVIAGFSQGACLASESVARHPRPYGGVAALTGGLIGPPGTPREYPGRLDGVPVYLGAGDPDPHVPWERVEESAAVLERMGARVTMERFPGLPHSIHPRMVERLQAMVETVAGR